MIPLPTTIAVAHNGAVTIESGSRTIGMSPFSDRAKRLTLEFGPGTHVLRTEQDVEDIPTHALTDVTDALA